MFNFISLYKRNLLYICSFFILIVGVFKPLHVDAYTADTPLTGYPFIFPDEMNINIQSSTSSNWYRMELNEQNSYSYNPSTVLNGSTLVFGNNHTSFVYPYDPNLFDYYIIGTLGSYDNNHNDNFNFSDMFIGNYDNNEFVQTRLSNIMFYDFTNNDFNGKSFTAKISEYNNGNISLLYFIGSYSFDSTLHFSASIVPVSKGSDESAVLNSILQKLIEINNNIVQHDTNVGSWISDFKNSVGSLMATLIQKVDAGFTALYNQMTKEQDEKLNGYDGSVASGAKDEFDSGASDLTAIEGTLNSSSTTFVNDFTSTGFDSGILTTLGASLTFVVTWFTNFWNMGGIWTLGLSTCFAIWIAFYILRTRSK